MYISVIEVSEGGLFCLALFPGFSCVLLLLRPCRPEYE